MSDRNLLSNLVARTSTVIFDEKTEMPAVPRTGQLWYKEGVLYIYSLLGGEYVWIPLNVKTKSYAYEQVNASMTWNINHNLNDSDITYAIYDENHRMITASNITIVDNNNLTLEFFEAERGKCLIFAIGNESFSMTNISVQTLTVNNQILPGNDLVNIGDSINKFNSIYAKDLYLDEATLYMGGNAILSGDGLGNISFEKSIKFKNNISFENAVGFDASAIISGVIDSAHLPAIDTFPDQTGNTGKLLSTNGTDTLWTNSIDASFINSGTIDLDRIPAGALDRLIIVTDETARFALTTGDVQNGDTVKQNDIEVMYRVVDDTNLNSAAGYVEYTAARATAVDWTGIENKPATFTPSSHDNTYHSTNYADELRTITAGNGLTGGGNLTADRTLTIGTPGNIGSGSTNNVTVDSHTHAASLNADDIPSLDASKITTGIIDSAHLPEIDTFPDQTGNTGKLLSTNGTDTVWSNELNELFIINSYYTSGVRNSTISANTPTGGKNGDVWLKY